MEENEEIEQVEENGTPAIFLRKVPVYIQDGDEEPRLLSAGEEEPEKQEE